MSEEAGSASAGNPGEGGEGATELSWLGETPDQGILEFVQNKGWKDPASAIESYRNLESKFGADRAGRTVVLPGENASDDERAEFYNRLGRPETADKYEISVPEGMGDEYAGWAREQFHKLGLTAAQAKALTDANNEYVAAAKQKQAEAETAKAQQELEALKGEWGAAFESKIEAGKKAVKAFGLDETVLEGLESRTGAAGLLKFMAEVGAKLGEDSYVDDGTPAGGGPMTPAQAQAALQALNSDKEFQEAWLSRTHPKHAEALARKSRLVEMAFPS